MKLPKFPRRLTNGVTIYCVQNGAYNQFRVASYDSTGRRKFQTFGTYDEAKQTAEKVNDAVAQGDVDAVVLTGAQKVEYHRAVDLLRPLGLSLDMAAQQITEAAKLVPSIMEACRYYAKTHRTKLERKSVAEVVQEFTEAKTQAGRSEDYLGDIRYRCGRFKDAFHCCIADIDGAQIREFLASLTHTEGDRKGQKLSGRSLNNFKRSITTLFEFAKARHYVPLDFDPLAGIDDADEGDGAIEIYSPKEVAALLTAATPSFLPALAIGAFAGLRSKEIGRLDWSEVQIARGFIEVKASKAKTAARRLVPIAPNLAQWLAPYANHTGRVWPHSEAWLEESKRDTAKKAEVAWKHNALRHSFVSYRLADVQDVARVALEAGNSPQMIFNHYRELVTPGEAKTWFSICPEQPENVIAPSLHAQG